MSLLRQLHAASLPFVARALRGGRRLRYATGALMLAVLTVVLGFWIALGPGRLEHELRASFNLERSMYQQELIEGKIFAEDDDDLRRLERQLHDLQRPDVYARLATSRDRHGLDADWRVVTAVQNDVEAVLFAATAPTTRDHHDLQRRARTLQAELRLPQHTSPEWSYLNWYDADDIARIEHAVDRRMQPQVVIYGSPLGVADATRLTGMLAGGVTLLLLLLFAPVLAGTQMAQEVHENTLQPLTGTALGARDLVLGMTVGPLAVIGLVAAPQVVLLLGAAAALGSFLPALAALAVAVVGCLFLTMLAQLAGLALGRQRTPGLIGVALLGALVPLTMLGAALALELPSRAVGLLALLPQAAAAYLLFGSFIPAHHHDPFHVVTPDAVDPTTALVVGTLGMLCFAWLGLRALERRVGDLAPTALTRLEALFGALVSVVLITLANPFEHHTYNPNEFYLLNLGIAAVPLAILLMMRVPQSDGPVALRRVPLGALVGEFAAMVGLHFLVAVAVMGPENLEIVGSPIALAYAAWSIGVAALIAVRLAAFPLTLLHKLWLCVCSVGLLAAFVHAAWWTDHPHGATADIFALAKVSPLLGLLQVILLIAIPVTLVRALRNPVTAAQPEA
jgi:hypothetical protein